MITIKRGDMFAEEVDALVNPVNCVGVMGAGVALEFKRRWPRYFNDYAADCKCGLVRLRSIKWNRNTWPSGKEVMILSFPTKLHWRDSSHLDDIGYGLDALGNYLVTSEIRSMAMPALGCGLGGLAWNDVKDVVFQMLASFVPEIDIRLYEPH